MPRASPEEGSRRGALHIVFAGVLFFYSESLQPCAPEGRVHCKLQFMGIFLNRNLESQQYLGEQRLGSPSGYRQVGRKA